MYVIGKAFNLENTNKKKMLPENYNKINILIIMAD